MHHMVCSKGDYVVWSDASPVRLDKTDLVRYFPCLTRQLMW